MGAIASQITGLNIVYSTVYSDADQRKHQGSASLAFVWGIHRGPVNFPHKWPVTRKNFPFDDVIMFWNVAYDAIDWYIWFQGFICCLFLRILEYFCYIWLVHVLLPFPIMTLLVICQVRIPTKDPCVRYPHRCIAAHHSERVYSRQGDLIPIAVANDKIEHRS